MATSKGKSDVKRQNSKKRNLSQNQVTSEKKVKDSEEIVIVYDSSKDPRPPRNGKGNKPNNNKKAEKPNTKSETVNRQKPQNTEKVDKAQTKAGKPKSQKTPSNDQRKTIRSSYAFVDMQTTLKWCMGDAKLLASDQEGFVKKNSFQYYLIVNVWLILVGELCNKEAQAELLFSLKRDGVITTIQNASRMLDNCRCRMRGDDVQPYVPFPSIAFCEDIRIISEVLAFPKRFSPIGCDLRDQKAIREFYNVNKNCRVYGRSNGIKWLEERLKEKLAIMLKGFTKAYKAYSNRVYFSSGVCADAKYVSDKVKAYIAGNPDHEFYGFRFKTEDYKSGTKNAILGMKYSFHGIERDPRLPVFTCQPTCVPKNYKTPRIICPEPAFAASNKQGILRAMRDCLANAPAGMQIFDDSAQWHNQMLAFLGARDGNYATVDKSSASDSISAALMARVLPDDVWNAIWPFYISWFDSGNGNYIHKDMFASSGDPICFFSEGCLFSALEMVAEDLVDTFEGKRFSAKKAYTGRVFGDDIATETRVYQTYCDLAELLGFVVNREKSYGSGPFRESCGEDYYFGMNVSARYWPRREIELGKPESIESIISLQHRLYNCVNVRLFLTDVVVSLIPDMTFSCPGDACDDLWGPISEVPTVSCPVEGTVTGEYALREVHYMLQSRPVSGDNELVQLYRYYTFLAEGPLYDDKLSKLLNVSSPRSRNGEFGKPVLTFRRKRKS